MKTKKLTKAEIIKIRDEIDCYLSDIQGYFEMILEDEILVEEGIIKMKLKWCVQGKKAIHDVEELISLLVLNR